MSILGPLLDSLWTYGVVKNERPMDFFGRLTDVLMSKFERPLDVHVLSR